MSKLTGGRTNPDYRIAYLLKNINVILYILRMSYLSYLKRCCSTFVVFPSVCISTRLQWMGMLKSYYLF